MDMRQWFTDVITIHPISGRTGSGDLEYSASYTIKGRVERGRLRKILQSGATEAPRHVIWSDQPLSENMRVVLPGEDTKRVPQEVESSHDKAGSYTLYKMEVA